RRMLASACSSINARLVSVRRVSSAIVCPPVCHRIAGRSRNAQQGTQYNRTEQDCHIMEFVLEWHTFFSVWFCTPSRISVLCGPYTRQSDIPLKTVCTARYGPYGGMAGTWTPFCRTSVSVRDGVHR